MLDDLGGLRSEFPVTAGIAVVAGLGMAGVPPVNGFHSKELLFEAAYHLAEETGGLAWLVPAVAVFGSVFTFLYSIRFVAMFFGDRPEELGEVHSPPLSMLAPPALLAVIAAVVGVVPQVAVDVLIQQTFAGVSEAPSAVEKAHEFEVAWPPTKVKPALIMSAITVGVGAVAYTQFARIRDAIRAALEVRPLRMDFWYDTTVEGANLISTATVETVQTGLLRTYATWAVGTFSVLTLLGYAGTGAVIQSFDFPGPGITGVVAVVLILAVVGALAVGNAPSHIAGVLTLSIVGFMIAIFYILSSAPDLALTQLLIETLVLVIFLLVLDRLPSFYGEIERSVALRDAAVSLFAGATVFVTVMESTGADPSKDLKHYLVENAGVPADHGTWILGAGGGGNVVNVILVDFRAFDTLGEISVIALAALSVLTLVAMRDRGETQ